MTAEQIGAAVWAQRWCEIVRVGVTHEQQPDGRWLPVAATTDAERAALCTRAAERAMAAYEGTMR